MPTKFEPHYTLTPTILSHLQRIDAAKLDVASLPLSPHVLASLRETARLYTTHYSTMIEGNKLTPEQVVVVLKKEGNFPGRERDESEVKGYYAGLAEVEKLARHHVTLTEQIIQTLHALVSAGGKKKVRPTPYRDGQNVIRDGMTGAIVYLPPEAQDVPELMRELVEWINTVINVPCPIIAAIAHYQFATIHPYYDGNGRTARLLTTLILHLGGYDLRGIYSLEEYYARNLGAYYEAISVGESHNYYMGRAEADITKWVEYFIEGMAISFENVLKRMSQYKQANAIDHSESIRMLDPEQRRVLELFIHFETVTVHQIADLFGFSTKTTAQLCKEWVESGFLKLVGSSSGREKVYALAEQYRDIMK